VKTLSYEANPFKNLGKFDCLFDFYQKICYNTKKDFFTDRETGQPHLPRGANREVDFYKKILYNIYVNNEREVITDVQYE
jgi:hypothetical protein